MIVDQPRDRGRSLALLAGVVDRDELDLATLDATLRVLLLDREPDRLIRGDAERRLRTGHRCEVTDHDRATRAARSPATAVLLTLVTRHHRDDRATDGEASPSIQIHGVLLRVRDAIAERGERCQPQGGSRFYEILIGSMEILTR